MWYILQVEILPADLILKNANVITVDAGQPGAAMVAVRDDKIIRVAASREGEIVGGGATRVIDCRGKTLVPGFIDAHCHIFSFIRKLLSVDLSPSSVSSIADIKAAIRRQADNTPPGQWITGTDYNDFYLEEKRHPTRWEIDEVAPDHPVVLSHRSLHACVLNSRALALAGITRETAEPQGGVIERDADSGEPDGLLLEMLGHIREKVMPVLSATELDTGVTLANQNYLAHGITSLQDATFVNNLERWQKFRRFKDEGKLKSRLYMMTGIENLGQFQQAGLAFASGDNHLRLGGVKILLNAAGGELYPAQAELNRQVASAQRDGFQLAIHAVRMEAVEAAITALEYARDLLPAVGLRHRIEHCSECPPHLLERLARLQALVVTQPPFIYYSGQRYLATVAPERQPWLYRIASFLANGLIVAASSDSPIVPDNPLAGICAAVTRQAESGQYLLPEESIPADQALALYTLNAAYASGEETLKGSVTQGKLADLVLLSDDPTRVPPEAIKNIRVEMTIIGGEVVYQAPD